MEAAIDYGEKSEEWLTGEIKRLEEKYKVTAKDLNLVFTKGDKKTRGANPNQLDIDMDAYNTLIKWAYKTTD